MILRGSVFSKVLGMETGIAITAPAATGRPYRTAYLLHGLCGSSGSWLDYSLLPLYAQEHDVIFIMPETARSFYTDMSYGLRYFTYVSEELPALCRGLFNLSLRREDTAMIGCSSGGYGALKCALTRSDLFGSCAAISSACLFLREGLDEMRAKSETPEFRAAWGDEIIADFRAAFGPDFAQRPGNDLLELARGVAGQRPSVCCLCGHDDLFLADNLRFSVELRQLGFEVTFEEMPGGHDLYFFDQALKKAIGWCFCEGSGSRGPAGEQGQAAKERR